jgi:ABC-type multidrug transport system ATPase subunit
MGPSGAGKTSLLNILAGRAASRGPLTIESDVRLNNYSVNPTDINVRKHIAFVAQDDSLQITSTPRESIFFSAKLRLPRATPEKNLYKLVNRMLKELGLEQCADTYVGGALLKGISGGERKRTSIGVELVVRPAMVFLDEPTSGLDSFSAVQLCQVLKKVANAGSSVLFTIHQPASEIFSSFDSLILMNKGRVMYQGAVDGVPDYFQARGNPLPPKYNPADWIMSVAQSIPISELDSKRYFPKDERKLPEPFTDKEEGKDELGITITERHSNFDFDESPVGIFVQIKLLFTRELRNLRRDKVAVAARFGLTTFLSILVGTIFLNVGASSPFEPAVRLSSAISNISDIISYFVCYLELAKSVWCIDYGRLDEHVRYCPTGPPCVSRRAPSLSSRIFHESLLCCFIFLVPPYNGSCHHCGTNFGAMRHHLFFDQLQGWIRNLLPDYLCFSHVKYCTGSDAGVFCGGSEAGTRNASPSFRSTNVVCWLLCQA